MLGLGRLVLGSLTGLWGKLGMGSELGMGREVGDWSGKCVVKRQLGVGMRGGMEVPAWLVVYLRGEKMLCDAK